MGRSRTLSPGRSVAGSTSPLGTSYTECVTSLWDSSAGSRGLFTDSAIEVSSDSIAQWKPSHRRELQPETMQ
jgi:hypothetical protein